MGVIKFVQVFLSYMRLMRGPTLSLRGSSLIMNLQVITNGLFNFPTGTLKFNRDFDTSSLRTYWTQCVRIHRLIKYGDFSARLNASISTMAEDMLQLGACVGGTTLIFVEKIGRSYWPGSQPR